MPVTENHRFLIANVGISLEFSHDRTAVEIPVHYRHFRAQESANPADEIRFRVVAEKPHLPGDQKYYHMQSPLWNVIRAGGEVYYELMIPMPCEYHHVIQHEPSSSEGVIYTHVHDGNRVLYPLFSPVDQAVLISALSIRSGLLVHACGLVKDGRALLFSGFSGVGKTTTAALWKDRPGVTLLNDDRIFLRLQGGKIWAYGTPWSGSNYEKSPAGAPLNRVFFLNQAAANRLVPLRPTEAASRLLVHAFPAYWNKNLMSLNLEMVNTIVTSVPCFDFHSVLGQSAADFIECQL